VVVHERIAVGVCVSESMDGGPGATSRAFEPGEDGEERVGRVDGAQQAGEMHTVVCVERDLRGRLSTS
jgi:hypothetical protein